MNIRLLGAFTAAFLPGVALAQHVGQHAGAAPGSAEMVQCARVQPAVENIIVAAMSRLESSRQSNNAADMRATVDQLEASLRDIRAQLTPCAAAAAATDPHAGMTMPAVQTPAAPAAPTQPATPGVPDPHAGHATPAAPAAPKTMPATKPAPAKPASGSAADPHAGHATPATPSTAKPAPASKQVPTKAGGAPTGDPHAGHAAAKPAPAAKSSPSSKAAPAKPSSPAKADPHAGHGTGTSSAAKGEPSSKPAPGKRDDTEKQRDPVNGLMVDPSTTPKTTYQGQTYYFSSEQSKKEFLENPAKFAKKPKG